MKFILLILLFSCSAFSISVDSIYQPVYDDIARRYPSSRPYPYSLYPFFMLPDSIVDTLPPCDKRIFIGSYEFDVCGHQDKVGEVKIQAAMVSYKNVVYRLFYYVWSPISKSWSEERPPLEVYVNRK
jgi:hypothetical protein